MPTKIVDDDDQQFEEPCLHPGHNPPTHIHIPPGKKMVHECPACGKKTTVKGSNVTL